MNLLTIVDSDRFDISAYQALHMAAQFQALGHRSVLMCPAESPLCLEAPKHDLAAKRLTLGRRMGFFGGTRFDIVHFYDSIPESVLMLKRISAESRIFISRIRLGGTKEAARLKKLEPFVARFLAACPSGQEDLCAAGIDPARTFVVPPGIHLGRWESAMLIKPAMFQKRPFKVGTVSMDRSLKEQAFFLKVAKAVLEKIPDTNFAVVGLNDDRIRKMARDLGISHKVDVLWDRSDMPEVMAMLHLFLKTSPQAGLSMSLIEAQASGVACVVAGVRGLRDYITSGRNGIVAESGDAGSFAGAVVSLIENPALCHTISRMAYDQVNFNMSFPVVTNLMQRLYEDALFGG